jgi:hypothetical protein
LVYNRFDNQVAAKGRLARTAAPGETIIASSVVPDILLFLVEGGMSIKISVAGGMVHVPYCNLDTFSIQVNVLLLGWLAQDAVNQVDVSGPVFIGY